MDTELEENSVQEAEGINEAFTGIMSNDIERILPVLCSIAISLKGIRDELNTWTSTLRQG